ncbi:phosphotransferase [Nonomuraea sp. NBC_01738]|uniref:phosphotransferase n=1 Tax=Nonomuraea sp. NBC_01738 TaxID=2976003 RepID=UPI002E0F59CC|nr:phosphotransferase [Nonomuraea sp. NBC_01738]
MLLLGSGRTADVYALDDDWALRRYREPWDTAREAAVMARLAGRGYPAPRVRSHGPAEIVLERLRGPVMVEALMDGTLQAGDAGVMLAGLLRDLHELDTVVHLDLHPENVILTANGPVVIDWSNARDGDPALDRAVSALILAEVAVGPRIEAAVAGEIMASLVRSLPLPLDLDGALAMRAANPTLSPEEKAMLDPAARLVAAALLAHPSGGQVA